MIQRNEPVMITYPIFFIFVSFPDCANFVLFRMGVVTGGNVDQLGILATLVTLVNVAALDTKFNSSPAATAAQTWRPFRRRWRHGIL